MLSTCQSCKTENVQCSYVNSCLCANCYMPHQVAREETAKQNKEASMANLRIKERREFDLGKAYYHDVVGEWFGQDRRVSQRRRLLSAPELEMLLGGEKCGY